MHINQFFKNRKTISAILFFATLLILYSSIYAGLIKTPIYQIANAHDDRLFSADDIYYVKNFYNVTMEDSMRIIKHPMLVVFCSLFTHIEQILFGELSIQTHYELIVCIQIVCSLLSVFYLYKILAVQYKLKLSHNLLLCAIYATAFSTVFFTFIAESFIISALLLMMSYYYIEHGNFPMASILGALTAGITITNAFLWALIVLFSFNNWKYKLKTIICGGVLFIILVSILPVRSIFWNNIISGSLNSARNYSDNFSIIETISRLFFAFFGSTIFYINTTNASPFDDFRGDALSFIPSASLPIIIMSFLSMVLLVYSIIINRKEKSLYPALTVLLFNFLLHGVIQYGLKEAFLYSLHHLAAQILIIGHLFKSKPQKIITIFFALFLICEILLNIRGCHEIIRFIIK